MSLGQKVRHYRKERGITLADLACKIPISTSYLSSLERGLRKPTIPMLKRISEELNISVAYLVGETDDAVTAEKLRFMRESRSLSLEDLSEISEIPLLTLKKFETGKVVLSADDLQKLSGALNVPLGYFQGQGKGNDLGDKLKKLRIDQGLTVTALAEKADVSPGLITQIEKGQTTPLLHTLEAIARTLKVSVSYFLLQQEDIKDLLANLSPDVLDILGDPKVQAVLRVVKDFDTNELNYIVQYINFFKTNRYLL